MTDAFFETFEDRMPEPAANWGVAKLSTPAGRPFYVIRGVAPDLERLNKLVKESWAPTADLEPLRAHVEAMRLLAPYPGQSRMKRKRVARDEAASVVTFVKATRSESAIASTS
jgi:hypothetical protein